MQLLDTLKDALSSFSAPFRVDVCQRPERFETDIYFTHTFTVPESIKGVANSREVVDQIFTSFDGAVRQTDTYKRAMDHLNREIEGYLDQLEKAHKEIEVLRKYKHYYDLEKELRHNNKGDDSAN